MAGTDLVARGVGVEVRMTRGRRAVVSIVPSWRRRWFGGAETVTFSSGDVDHALVRWPRWRRPGLLEFALRKQDMGMVAGARRVEFVGGERARFEALLDAGNWKIRNA